MTNPRSVQAHCLGQVEYEDGLQLQKLVGEGLASGVGPEALLLLEHPPVVTLGRGAKPGNILLSKAALEAKGVQVFETNRGGDVTYHGPGQWVGYPILQLEGQRQDVRRYVRDVEELMIRVCAHFGVLAGRIPQWAGVWVGQPGQGARKIGAIGVHISRWRTSHGFALNVNTDLTHFDWIVPCGIREAAVTSLQRELGTAVAMDDVLKVVLKVFADVFERPVQRADSERQRTVAVVPVRSGVQGPEVLLLKRTAARGGFWQPVTGRVEQGETEAAAAAREFLEETGARAPVTDLAYAHAFAWGDAVPPRLVEARAYVARWPGGEVRIDPAEHDEAAWVSVSEALGRVPFAGLKEAVRRAVALKRS